MANLTKKDEKKILELLREIVSITDEYRAKMEPFDQVDLLEYRISSAIAIVNRS